MLQALSLQSTARGSPELSVATLKPLHPCLAERGTISSVELDGSRFQVVREGLHGLALFTIGEGFLLWSTTSTNGRSVGCALPSSSCYTRTWGSASPCGGAGLLLCGVKGKLGEPLPPISGTLVGGGGAVLTPCVSRLQQDLAQPAGAG